MAEGAPIFWESIGEKVLKELERRLGSASDAADLPGTLLMRLAEMYIKFLEKEAANKSENVEYMTALEAIDQEGLPVETKKQILADYIAKLEEDVRLAQAKMEEISDDVPPVP